MALNRNTYKYWDVRLLISDKDTSEIHEGKEALKGAILNLFKTKYGNRAGILMPDFGSRIHLFLHENIDDYTATAFRMTLIEDLRKGFPIANFDFSRTVVKPITTGPLPGYYVFLSVNESVLTRENFSLEFNALME